MRWIIDEFAIGRRGLSGAGGCRCWLAVTHAAMVKDIIDLVFFF
jgi:hypothetical protein